jgi:KUP system potassium uptake protein
LHNTPDARRSSTAALSLLALGVVFGDIGTSPLYALKATFDAQYGIALTPPNIIGGCSTIFWSLIIVVSLKYVTLVMRADNKGEGGIEALLALALSSMKTRRRWTLPLMLVGLAGASLFYGDAVVTPAISVLSAIEGLEVGTSAFKPYVLPMAITVIVALFAVQSRGSTVVGTLFGPVCLLWFIALAASGIHNIILNPTILHAVDPMHALDFVTGHGLASFFVLGAVLLAITGTEALYADMGHFGRSPIRLAWFGVVFPSLVLNYFGQGALLIADPTAVENPFFLAYPSWALYPMVVLATAATVIASQAMISGAFSITRQAIQLGYLPRLNVLHTSEQQYGQIYLPAINWTLLVGVLIATIGFGSSSALAAAYGVAVMGTMVATTFLTFFVIRYDWRYNLWVCILATGFFAIVDVSFFSASLVKIRDGGWFPLVLGSAVLTLMLTWRRGREILLGRLKESSVPLGPFLQSLLLDPPLRVAGTAVFLTSTPDVVPHALLHNLAHNKVLHQRVVFLTVIMDEVPRVAAKERIQLEPLGEGCYRLLVRFGFKDRPDVPGALELCRPDGLEFNRLSTSFFLSREIVIPTARNGNGMALWRERLFATMARNASSVVEYFNLPTNRVIELGTQIEI